MDEDRLLREATAWILTDAGYKVTQAKDGFDAVARLEQPTHFDLVISDISRPHTDGPAVGKAVNKVRPDVPLLLVSSRAQPPGVHSFMMKPFNASTLLRAIAAIVAQRARVPYPGL